MTDPQAGASAPAGRSRMALTEDQADVVRWFFSQDSDDVRLVDVRARFAAVGLHSKDDVEAALFPAPADASDGSS